MKLPIPNSDKHSKVLVTMAGQTFRQQFMFNDNVGSIDVDLPAAVDARMISVVAHFCDNQGVPDPECEPIILKQAEPIPADPPTKRRVRSAGEHSI